MYANFTEETATGTGDVLTLSGATSGNIPFSASFLDGDLVAYVIEDSSGVKVSGIGIYSAGTITRDDTWNYNGSVVDSNPSANIALDGVNTVRSSNLAEQLTAANLSFDISSYSGFYDFLIPNNINATSTTRGRGNNDAPFNLVYQPYSQTIHKLGIEVTTADAASTNNLAAIYTVNKDLMPGKLLVSTSHLSGENTGVVLETLSTPLHMPAGWYYYSTKSDSSTLRTLGASANSFTSPLGFHGLGRVAVHRINIDGAYPSTAPTTGYTAENNGFSTPIFTLA